MGCRLPGAPDLTGFWRGVQRGAVPVREVPAERWDHSLFHDPNPRQLDRTYARLLASVDDIEEFSPEHFGILPRRARFMDPQQRLVLDAARMAIEDAGVAPARLPRRTGVYIGVSVSEYYQLTTARMQAMQLRDGRMGRVPPGMEAAWDFLLEDVPPLQAYSMVGQMLNMAAANVSQAFDLRGPAQATDSACSSALVALADAVLALRAGVCDAALVGGVFVAVTPNNMVAFSRIGAISPSDACRPFDERADGFVLGEGAGCLLVKRLDDAVRDGDRIWAVVRGVGINNDGRGEGPMTPRLEGQVAALEQAYADAAMSPAQVGLVEAHGTATRVGDFVEATSLAQVLGAARRGIGAAPPCYVTSIKRNIGHTLAAAGAAGLINASLALAHRRIPPLAGYEQPRGDLPLGDAGIEVAAGRSREWPAGQAPRAAGVSSFGFGGTNVHVVLEEAPAAARTARWAPGRAAATAVPATAAMASPAELFVVSAPSAPLLARSARALAAWVGESESPLADVAYTLSRRRVDAVRVAVVARTRAELAERLAHAADAADAIAQGAEVDATADGVFLFAGTAEEALAPAQVAFLFPGQGAQAPDLCRDLWDGLPAYRDRLGELARAAEPVLGRSFLGVLYPAAEARDAAAAELTRTEVCQPALAAVELALVEVLRGAGVAPGVVIGHSLGEFVAAAAGGVLDAGDTVRLVAERGRLMAELDGDHGAMAALSADREGAARLIAGLPGAVLANLNHSRQTVVSGETAAVDEVVARAGAAGVRATRLAVSHGFHSPIVAPMASRFSGVLAGADVRAPAGTVVVSCAADAGAGLEPGPFESEPEAIRARLARHALAAIDFESGVRAAWRAGARVFLQVGGGSALLSMVNATLAHDGCAARLAAPVAPADSAGGEGLLTALARLVGLGLPVATTALFHGRDVALAAMPSSLLETRPFWVLRRQSDPPPLPVLGANTAPDAGQRNAVNIRSMSDRVPGNGVAQEEPEMSERSPAQRELVDLFQRQLDVIQGQLDVLRSRGVEAPASLRADAGSATERAAAPGGAQAASWRNGNGNGNGHAPHRGPLAIAAPAAQPAPARSERIERASVEKQVLEVVSRVSALPVSALPLSARLTDDLGIDSLMMVEIGAGVQESFGLREVPDGVVGRGATLGDVVDRLTAHLQGKSGTNGTHAEAIAAPAAVPARAAGDPSVERHVAEWTAHPLAPGRGELAGPGSALIVADAGAAGVAEALARRLRAAGRAVDVIGTDGDHAWPPAAGLLVDISGVSGATSGATSGVDSARTGDEPAALSRRMRAPLARATAALASAARLGIRPAYVAATAGPAFAATAGFARALAAEWPDRLARAVELPAGLSAELAAERIAAEIAGSDRTPEVSWASGERRTVTLRPAPTTGTGRVAARTALVTGGGRGLGGKLALALARAGVARLALVGRRPADAEVDRLVADIAAAGAVARYIACDVRDPDSLAAAMAEARTALGPIEIIAHAAGVNADGAVEKIRGEDLERVFDTKVAGALGLWRASAADPLAAFLLYGSWAGRFGNRHQAIYAAANRALSGLVGRLAAERPAVRVAAVDLPPWEGSGMVDRLPEPIQRAMRARGVPFLRDEVGLGHLLAELGGEPGGREVVLGAGPSGAGRRDRARIALDPAAPWLADHAPGGEVRLPLAAAFDMAVAAAERLGLTPPLAVLDFQVLQAITVPTGGRAIEVEARRVDGGAVGGAVDVELWLEADDPLRGEPRLVASARVAPVGGPLPAVELGAGEMPRLDLDRFYAEHTFHGPRMRGIARVDEVGEWHVRGAVATADASWPRAGLDILGLDGALQLAAFFARDRLALSALPIGAGECRVLAPLPPASQLRCAARLERADGDELVGHIDLYGGDGGILVQLRRLHARVVDGAALERADADGTGNGARNGNGNGSGNGTAGGNGNGRAGGNGHSIDPATYRIEQFPELVELTQRMKMVEALGLRNPYFHQHDRLTNQRSTIEGVEFVNYSAYNYVGLSGHPEVNRAVEAAIARYGTSVSASRVASGEKPLHRELEAAIADFLGCEDAVVMVGGHATNVSVIGHMLDSRDVIVHDSLAHDSILGGAKLAGARRRPFPHNDMAALERMLEQVRPNARRLLIAVEGVYSMDGDMAPLDRIIELKRRFGALLLVDEAHSLGVIGATGRGIGERYGVDRADVDLWMGTLSKSLASCGGYIAGSAALVQFLKYTNPGFVYSVGISPANAAAALAALRILEREPERVAALQARSRFFLERLRERGVDTGLSHGSAVVPCIVPSSVDCLRLAQALSDRRINVQPILYPAVEENLARLRFFVTSGHSEADLLATADAVREELAAINPRHLRSPDAPDSPDAHDAAVRRTGGPWEATP